MIRIGSSKSPDLIKKFQDTRLAIICKGFVLVLEPVFCLPRTNNVKKYMEKFILGKKIGMTTVYDEGGAQNLTLIECSSRVTLLRTKEKDGYASVQISLQKTKKRTAKKEFRIENSTLKVGDVINVELFLPGEKVQH